MRSPYRSRPNRKTTRYLNPSGMQLLSAAETKDELAAGLLALNKEYTRASAATRRKWHNYAQRKAEALGVQLISLP